MAVRNLRRGNDSRARMIKYILAFQKERGYSPTFKEIMLATGLKSLAAVHYHIWKMRMLGIIDVDSRVARSIRVIKVPEKAG